MIRETVLTILLSKQQKLKELSYIPTPRTRLQELDTKLNAPALIEHPTSLWVENVATLRVLPRQSFLPPLSHSKVFVECMA